MKTILKATGIKKSFGDKRVLDDINITLGEGELVSILGTSGVGKTTLFDIISGLTLPDEGRVILGGRDVTADFIVVCGIGRRRSRGAFCIVWHRGWRAKRAIYEAIRRV